MALTELKDYLVPVITAVLGAGFWDFMKKRQEKPLDEAKAATEEKRADEVMIQGATSVVELQQKVMKQLQEDLDRRVKAIEDLYSKQLESERREWERERSKLENQVTEMSQRLGKLEEINKRLLQENELLAKCDHCIAEAAAAQ
ncbi:MULTISPECIES: hypothetical protein [Vibrio]|uniref:hypothetical protein n=1 Tax=Vibrio TaxID=662 RepID=UPI000CD37479|nr:MULTISPECIES: hypothetical protein [Vibrio]AUW07566.1 hypothetical protein C1N51_28510 [Vibrio campbellii]MBY7719658.1 hypothetical protein [Vibrio parahaemolyticus]MDF5600792.1 hypothetical protein [Vibrio parahaemolyticus]MDW2094048.1 hypothetical protein [Vibrio sp. 1866]MDW3103725.1 hypothetical protein [Vibrio sp. 1874]